MSTQCWIKRESKTKYPGKPYIINVIKGESYWGLIPDSSNPLSIGWEAYKSSNGKIYYANQEPESAQWEKPKEDKTLAENWITLKSKKCDQIYYKNTITNETQWNFPNSKTPNIPKSTQYVDERELLRQEAEKHGKKALLDAEKRKQDEEKSREAVKRILESDEREKQFNEHESLEEVKRIVELQKKQKQEQREKTRLAEIELARLTQQRKDTEEATLKVLRDAYIKGSSFFFTERKESLNPDNVTIKWLSKNGSCELTSGDGTQRKTGRYSFNQDTLEIITELENVQKSSNVMIAKCNASYESMREFLRFIEKSKHLIIGFPRDIELVLSNVQDIIQGTSGHDYSKGRHKMIVLPSQLNGAEYQSQGRYHIVEKLNEYLGDNTGGPRGQLAADPGVAQFIIDNAFNQTRSSRNDGINNVKEIGIRSYLDGDKKDDLGPVYLINGYLQVKNDVDVERFIDTLPEMTILGVRDVPVRGLDKNYRFIKDKDIDTVDLIYASAVPLDSYGNSKLDNVVTIAKLTLFSQYVGAMRLAILRGNCDLYLTPLGGGAFRNNFEHIKAAILMAYTHMKSELERQNIYVKVIVWEGDDEGRGGDERKAFGFVA